MTVIWISALFLAAFTAAFFFIWWRGRQLRQAMIVSGEEGTMLLSLLLNIVLAAGIASALATVRVFIQTAIPNDNTEIIRAVISVTSSGILLLAIFHAFWVVGRGFK